MAELGKNVDAIRKALNKIRGELEKLAREQEELSDKLEILRDDRWTWACETILKAEQQRVAFARCDVAPEQVVLGAIAQGQFNECTHLLGLRSKLEAQENECTASIKKQHAQMDALERKIANP